MYSEGVIGRDEDVQDAIASSLCVLYLRGFAAVESLPRRRWPQVIAALRAKPNLGPSEALRFAGLTTEALLLEDQARMEQAYELRKSGKCATAIDQLYPSRWLAILRESAPPAFWMACTFGDTFFSSDQLPMLAIVGGRDVPDASLQFAFELGAEAARLGFAVCSGGARGCDLAGERGASSGSENQPSMSTVRVLPHGLCGANARDALEMNEDGWPSPSPGSMYISLCSPQENFSTANAMERNTLIYASSAHSVVVHTRYQEGGTWTGATQALRRRLTQILVREDHSLPGHRALVGLGALPLVGPSDLSNVLKDPGSQPTLFSFG